MVAEIAKFAPQTGKTPEELKLIMVDPKSVEFTAYASLPHLMAFGVKSPSGLL